MTALLAAAAGAASGAIVGSFLATLILRWPQNRSVVAGRSCCDYCERQLHAVELVPLLSRIAAKGRCRSCGGAIDPFHSTVELTAAAIGASALAAAPGPQGAALALLGWLSLPLAWLDWRHQWLPDRLTMLLGLAGILCGGFLSAPLLDRLIGAIAGGGVLALIALAYARLRGRQGLGAGDPKLMAAIGAWVGWVALPPILFGAALIGLVVAIARRLGPSDSLPFGTMLLVATWTGTAGWTALN